MGTYLENSDIDARSAATAGDFSTELSIEVEEPSYEYADDDHEDDNTFLVAGLAVMGVVLLAGAAIFWHQGQTDEAQKLAGDYRQTQTEMPARGGATRSSAIQTSSSQSRI